jgi:hypothetical protein
MTSISILWHIDSLLSNDSETKSETTAVTRKQCSDNNGGIMFFLRSTKQELKVKSNDAPCVVRADVSQL